MFINQLNIFSLRAVSLFLQCHPVRENIHRIDSVTNFNAKSKWDPLNNNGIAIFGTQ